MRIKQRKEFLWSAVAVGVFVAVYVMYAFAADRLDGFFASLDASTGITTVDLNASGSSTLQDGVTLGDGTAKDISILLSNDGTDDPYLRYVTASDGLQLYTGSAVTSELNVVVGTTTRFTTNQSGTTTTGVHTITGLFSATGGGAFEGSVGFQNATETGIAWYVADTDPARQYAWMTLNGILNWEGATDNDFETTLTCTDPTADRAIVIPDLSGTWLLSNGVIASCDTIDTDSNGVAACGTDSDTKRTTLSAGEVGIMADAYLEADGDVDMSATVGFLIPRAGSITAVSCVVSDTVHSANGALDCEVHKNGSSVFAATVSAINGTGVYEGYATQAAGTDTIVAGDQLALYVNYDGTLNAVVNVIALVELELN